MNDPELLLGFFFALNLKLLINIQPFDNDNFILLSQLFQSNNLLVQ